MPRSKSCVPGKARRKRILERAKGFVLGRRKLVRSATETVRRAEYNAFRDRKRKKRDYRRLWIIRINAAVTMRDMSYSRFINGLKRANIVVNRKMLSMMAIEDPNAFTQLVETAKKALA